MEAALIVVAVDAHGQREWLICKMVRGVGLARITAPMYKQGPASPFGLPKEYRSYLGVTCSCISCKVQQIGSILVFARGVFQCAQKVKPNLAEDVIGRASNLDLPWR